MGFLGFLEIAALVMIVFAVVLYKLMTSSSGNISRSRSYSDKPANNPFIPDWMEQNPVKATIVVIVVIFIIITGLNCFHIVPPGHRGVLITMGKIAERNYGEGLQLKLPYFQTMVNMKVTLEKEEVSESTASSDLQEITTTLTVHFNVNPDMAWRMYQNMRKDYHQLLLNPVIQEDLKATTAQFTAEELIKTRALLVIKLKDKLSASLYDYGIQIQTVNFVNFEFTPQFMEAIEAKVTAQQKALEAKNKLEQIGYEAQQKIIQAEANKNATIIDAEAAARKQIIAAEAQAAKITIEANATAEAMRLITSQMTPEYQRYLYLQTWDGILPSTLVGQLEDLGLILDLQR